MLWCVYGKCICIFFAAVTEKCQDIEHAKREEDQKNETDLLIYNILNRNENINSRNNSNNVKYFKSHQKVLVLSQAKS